MLLTAIHRTIADEIVQVSAIQSLLRERGFTEYCQSANQPESHYSVHPLLEHLMGTCGTTTPFPFLELSVPSAVPYSAQLWGKCIMWVMENQVNDYTAHRGVDTI